MVEAVVVVVLEEVATVVAAVEVDVVGEEKSLFAQVSGMFSSNAYGYEQ